MTRWLSLLLGASLLALVAGCGQTPTPTLTLQLGSSSVSILRGDQDTVIVTVTRGGGAADPVTLSVSGAPANVAAALADTTLPAGSSATMLDLQVDPAASEGTATLTVHATSGSLDASAVLTLEVTSLTVHGSVHALLGDGFPGATVAIQGMTATTDADGAFTIAGVSVPYDVAVGNPVSTGAAGHLFVGLRAPDPVLTPYGALQISTAPGYYPSATVNGDLSAPVPTGSKAKVCLEGAAQAVYGCDNVAAGNTAYSIGAMWREGATAPFTLHALVTQLDANGVPTGYDAYGTATGTATNGATTTVNVTLGAAPATSTLALASNVPAGFDPSGFTAGAELSPTFTLPLFGTSGFTAAALSAPVPQFSGATYSAVASAQAGTGGNLTLAWKRGLAASDTASFTLDAPPTLVSPADGATGIGVGDTLQIAPTGGAPVTFAILDYSAHRSLLVTTMSDSITIPDLTDVGAPLLASHSYDWGVYRTPTSTTIDEAAEHWLTDYYATLLALQSGGPGSRVLDGTLSASINRTFTTP